MARILVVAELKASSSESADKIAENLIGVSRYSRENEPGVTKYMICRPSDASETDTVWAIEEYADKTSYDAHMNSAPVKDLITFMTTKPVLAGAPTIHMLSYVPDLDFTKLEAGDLTDPFIVFGDLKFAGGKRDGTVEHWKKNLESSMEESGTLIYGLAQAEDKPDNFFTLEVYESAKALMDVHIPSAAVQDTIANTKDVRENLTLAKLKLRGGYVHKRV